MKRKVEPLGGRDENLCGWLDGNTSWEWTRFLWVWLTIDKKLKQSLDWQDQWVHIVHGKLPHLMGFERRKGANWWIHTITQKHKTMDKWN